MKNLRKNSLLAAMLLLPLPCLPIEVYFSPKGGIKQRIIEQIRQERMWIHAALYFLTDKDLANELAKAARRGVLVEVICDQSSAEGDWSKVEFLGQEGVTIFVYDGGKKSIMHHKFWIFSDNTLITGSFNATRRANDENRENIVVIKGSDDPSVGTKFDAEFSRIKQISRRWKPEQSTWSAWTRGLTAWA